MTSTLGTAAREVLLALADDELCIGQRHANWIGIAPFLEEDLAFISIATDEIAHARELYRIIGTEDGLAGDALERSADHLAMGRTHQEYRSSWLAERPCTVWEDALVRHLLYDEAETLRWEALQHSTVAGLAELSTRILLEEDYHRRHARPLFLRLLRGTAESRRRVSEALDRLLPLARSLFEPTIDEDAAIAAGVAAAGAASLEVGWRRTVGELCAAGGLTLSWPEPAGFGGRHGVRSDDFAALHTQMGAVYALDPGARW